MAEHGPRDEAGKRRDPDIAAAEWLFRDDAAKEAAKSSGAAAPGNDAGSGDTFELADGDLEESAAEAGSAAPPIPAALPRDRPPARPHDAARPRPARLGESSAIEDEALVDVVWSRWAEWGPNLVVIAAWLFALAVILYFVMGWGFYGFGFFLLLVGATGAVLLSYPILITLERPVRITPEQAVRDFYGALSHHLPHFRRMWLLLTRTGQTTSSYGSFEGFKAYWTDTLRTIKGSRAGAMTPLVFEVENFRADKSAGKSRVDVKFTLKVSIRGQRQAGPVASIPGQMSLVRGPDNMWYLESGTLPHTAGETRSD
jgi:hypothetical protein